MTCQAATTLPRKAALLAHRSEHGVAPATRARAAWLSGISLAGLGRLLGPHPAWERRAAEAARHWLRLVDEGRNAASWRTASPLLREGAEPTEWETAMRSVRAPLGRCLSRRLRSHVAVDGPCEELQGPYVVVRYDSVFEHLGRRIETVTPVLGTDGCWRVAAYFVG
ncbi:MAG TPA: DUF4019 domain-containing protein [Vicinamibacteria bacterium]|nr:DUF4019 domain-containing protein [Vicinamibacteria bacterium]